MASKVWLKHVSNDRVINCLFLSVFFESTSSGVIQFSFVTLSADLLSNIWRKSVLRSSNIWDLLSSFLFFFADFYDPFREDELENSTKAKIMFPSDPPVSFLACNDECVGSGKFTRLFLKQANINSVFKFIIRKGL